MCCSSAKWKREVVPDHKFDFIDVAQFHSKTFGTRLSYAWFWTLFLISIAVYIADIYTLIALLASNRWSGQILQSEAAQDDSKSSNVLEVPFSIGKWIFFGCIIFSFLLLLWEARKARAIVKSRDISYAFTNVMSHNWYALRSYNHFCFFSQIDNSKKKKDNFAFFVFFTFKGWKRLLLADAPRQVINAITLWSFGKSQNWTTDFGVYFSGSLVKQLALATMLFTVAIFIISALQLLVAAVMYVPLLCYIQGNLKEYACHKVDKRIAELMKRKNRRRLAKEAELARREAAGDFRHLKDKKTGKLVGAPRPQPTLPKIGFDDGDLYSETGSVRGVPGGGGEKYSYPPPLGAPALPYGNSVPYGLARGGHAYGDSESVLGYGGAHGGYAESVTSVDGLAARAQPMGYGGGHGAADSTVSLALPGGGMGRAPSYRTNPSSRDLVVDGGYGAEPYDEKLANMQFGELAFDRGGTPALPGSGLNGSLASRTNVDYAPPSRQHLFERAARQNAADSADEHAYLPGLSGSDAGHARGPSGSHGGGGYGGWEESGPTGGFDDAQGYYRAPSRGVQRAPSAADSAAGGFAGRGAYGGYHR
ncbi:Potassium transporter [Rhodotorula kratochvilovae]